MISSARADAYGIDYNIVEAIDQPWKTYEGGVGPYWGIFDASRQAEILLDRPDHRSRLLEARRARACCSALLLSLPILAHERRDGGASADARDRGQRGRRLVRDRVRVLEGTLLRARRRLCARAWHHAADPAGAIALARMEEIAAHRVRPRRRAAARVVPAARARSAIAPKVSIHMPAYREPPEMLKATLDAVARLDYPNFECVVVINNTPDPALLAADRGALPRARRALQIHQCRQSARLQGRRAAAGDRAHGARTPRSSASSTPTMSCSPTGSRTWCRCSPIHASAWCRRRRITATANAR